jgi:hypothetical protein
MKFKIVESFVSYQIFEGDTYAIYKNPTTDELDAKDESKENRAIIDKNGDVYMEACIGKDAYSGLVHRNLIGILNREFGQRFSLVPFDNKTNWIIDWTSLKEGWLAVQRGGDSEFFYISESYPPIKERYKKQINRYFNKAEQKNPHISFLGEKIYDPE